MHLPLSNIHILSRPDGSALFTQGQTTVIAGVYGPTECKTAKASIDKAQIEMHYRPKCGLPNVGDRLYEVIMRNICETALLTVLYPRTSVVIVVQEMQNGGELIASAVNAACLALLDSGIDMKFLVAAVTCCLDENEQLTVDPTNLQLAKAKATFVYVFDSLEGGIVASHTTGSYSIENYETSMCLCKTNSSKIFDYYREVMKKKCAE